MASEAEMVWVRRVQRNSKKCAPGGAECGIDAYKRAWEISDGDAAALLFREDCICRTMPFRPLEAAQAYQRQAMASQTAKQVWFGEPLVSGNQVAVEYWAILYDLDEKQEMT